MTFRIASLFALSALICSCGKFNVSPYVSETKNLRLNKRQLSLILRKENPSSYPFKVAVISDTHNYYKELEKQVEYINKRRHQFEFVIVSGDLTNLGLLREFETAKSFLDELRVPFLTIPGNHDLISNGEEIYRKMFGPADYAFVYGQTKFVLFNNNNWESSGDVPNINFVESELSGADADPDVRNIVLVSHVSPGDDERWSQDEMNEMRDLVDSFGVDYFLHGHDHNPGEGSFGNATKITVGSSAKGKIVELEIAENGGITHRHVSF